MKRATASWKSICISAIVALCLGSVAIADQDDPPARVARLEYVDGAVSLEPGGTQDWVAAEINRPLTTGDQLWSDRESRAEVQLDGSLLRLANNTAISFSNLGDSITQIQLTSGSLLVRVRRLADDETYEIDTPNLAFSVLRPGLYRISVDEAGNTTTVRVRIGQGEVTGGGAAYPIYARQSEVFSGGDVLTENGPPYENGEDDFDIWSSRRDQRWDRSEASRYVSPDVVGYEDLDENGSWETSNEYGAVWIPRAVAAGWAPYHDGHWAYIAPWGYTWIDDQPWGFAPFHYGRWVTVHGNWAWIPCRPQAADVEYVRPVYAPALVAWVSVGAGVAWFPLGPREVFVPSYHVSRRYMTNVNVSNTTVNRGVINNVYNTTIVNHTTVNNTTVNYVNRAVPGAVAATSARAFANAEPVGRNVMRIDRGAMQGAPIRAFAPATAPTKQAVLGPGKKFAPHPPVNPQTRTIVARMPPPPPPAPQTAMVRIAPPAMSSPERIDRAPPRPMPGPALPAAAAQPPPLGPSSRPQLEAVHPRDLPVNTQPAAPADANSALERQHLQEQQQLRYRQEQQRQEIQRQQDAEHARVEQQRADDARRQQIELQHQQQTQLLMQQHLQEQQRQQQAQEQQRQQLQQEQQQRERQQEQAHQQEQQRLQEQSRQQGQARPPQPQHDRREVRPPTEPH